MTPINLLHDPLSPTHGIRYGSYSGRNPRSAVVLRQLSCCENAGGDQQHALATLVHFGSLALSPYVRYSFEPRRCGRSQSTMRNM